MPRIFTTLIASAIAIVVFFTIVTSFLELLPTTKTLAIMAIVLGITMALIGLNVRGSKPRISGSIGRKEIYGVATAIFGWAQLWIINLGGRIDQLYQILINMPKG